MVPIVLNVAFRPESSEVYGNSARYKLFNSNEPDAFASLDGWSPMLSDRVASAKRWAEIMSAPFSGYLAPPLRPGEIFYSSWPFGSNHDTVNPFSARGAAATGYTGFFYLRDQACWWLGREHLVYDPGSSQLPSARGLQYLEVRTSSKTVGWFGLQEPKVGKLTLTKSKFPTNRPKRPIFRAPRSLKTVRPVRGGWISLKALPPSQGSLSGPAFARKLELWSAKKRRREISINRLADERHAQKLAKHTEIMRRNAEVQSAFRENRKRSLLEYERKLATYNAAVEKSKDLIYRRSKSRDILFPDNPYGHIKMSLLVPPTKVEIIANHRYNRLGLYYAQGGIPQAEWDATAHQFEAWFLSSSISSDSPTEELAQFGEDIRKNVIAAINPHLKEFDQKLGNKILSKMKRQIVHVGNIIAERKQTMDMVQSSVKRILSLIKAKRTIFRTAAQYVTNPKAIANDILAFKFGVEPLMSDIQSFAKYLDEEAEGQFVVARSNLKHNGGVPITIDTPSFSFTGMLEMSYTAKCSVENPATRSLSQFGLINPLEILWEVTPWSFIVDWFLPVGEWLSSKTADCGLKFRTGTRKVKLTGSFYPGPLPANLNVVDPDKDYSTEPFYPFHGVVIDRSVLTDLPIFSPVRIKNPISWSHGIESVALLVQRLKIR